MKLLGFVAAGGVATAINVTVFVVLIEFGVHPLLSSAIGYVSGIGVSFSLNKRVVFRNSTKANFIPYFVSYFGAMFLQVALLAVLLYLAVPTFAANAMAIAIVVIINFFVIRKFAFS